MNLMEAYIQLTPGLIAYDGEVTDGITEQFLRDYMSEFEQFITRVLTVLPRTTVPSSIDDSQMKTASKASA
jgi:chromate reductase, NAD(P)H dehydrogenase (quinone)